MDERQRAVVFGEAIAASAFPHMKAGNIKKRAFDTVCADLSKALAKALGDFSDDDCQVASRAANAEAQKLIAEDRPKVTDAIRALITWRDRLALDWSGIELVDHVTNALAGLVPEERPGYMPPEHAEALKAFQAFSEDEQHGLVRTVIEDIYGMLDDDEDPYGYPD